MEKKPSTNNEKGKKPSTSFESSNREDEIKPNIEFSHSEDRKSIYSNQISFPDEEVRPKKDNFKEYLINVKFSNEIKENLLKKKKKKNLKIIREIKYFKYFKIFGEDYKNFKYFSEDQTRDKFYLEN